MPKCPECGEELGAQFDMCWNCGADNPHYVPPPMPEEEEPEIDEEDAGDEIPVEELSTEEMLREILHIQREQRKWLSTVSWEVGCLFANLVFGIVVAIIIVLLSLSGAF